MTAVRYEVAFDCRDHVTGERLLRSIESTAGDSVAVRAAETGPTTWSVTLEFPRQAAADAYLDGDAYRRFCEEVRRTCQASVLLIPLGPVE